MAFNVLVVDDSAVMRTMVVRTLKMSGIPLGSPPVLTHQRSFRQITFGGNC